MGEMLDHELETYKRLLPGLLDRAGHFVLIKGDDMIEVFASYEDALKEGYKRFGVDPFMVKQIEASQTIHFFSRDMQSCPA